MTPGEALAALRALLDESVANGDHYIDIPSEIQYVGLGCSPGSPPRRMLVLQCAATLAFAEHTLTARAMRRLTE